jgi:FkbM family methyltransferase
MIKRILKKIRHKWHGDIISHFDNKSPPPVTVKEIDLKGVNSEINQTLIRNQLIMHNQLICDEFSDFIRDLLEISKTRSIDITEIKNSIYYKFILNQDSIKKVWAVLDEHSRLTWYYLIILWVSTWIFAEHKYGLAYIADRHYTFINMLQSITGYKDYDLNASNDYAGAEKQYLCEELIKLGMFVIDGGAYTGGTAELFSNLVGNGGMVYSFEPTESSFKELIERKLENVQCFQKGLYCQECDLKFAHIDNSPAGNSLMPFAFDAATEFSIVPVTSIDKFMEDNNINRIDYIKLDIEGAELEALKGAKNTIRKYKPDLAICIYHNLGNDVIDIPIWLFSNFGNIYNFKVKHHSKGWWESVIYAIKKC